MMNLDIQRLSDENRYLIDGFSCVETDEMLAGLNAKERRRVRKHYSLPFISLRWSGITAVWFSSRSTAMSTGLGITRDSASSGIFTSRLCWTMTHP